MVKISSKILGLVGTAMMFTGVSYGQTFSCSAITLGANTFNSPILDRFEDTTALVADANVVCGAGSSLSSGTVTVSLNGRVTSKITNTTTGISEATLQIIDTASGNTTSSTQGTPSGNQILFTGVNFPATPYTIKVSNVRVNAAATAPNGTTNFPITESIFISNQGVAILNANPVSVGIVVQGFATPSVASVLNYAICSANPTSIATPSFTVTTKELFGGAFKTASVGTSTCGSNNAICSITNSEAGSLVNTTSGIGVATHGTRFQFAFANVPTGVTIYLPTSVIGTAGTNPVTVTMTASASGAFSAVTASVPTGSTIPAGYAPFTSTTGTVNAYYEVTATDNTVPGESFAVTGYVTTPVGTLTTAQAAITVTVTPAPTGSTDIPNFAASSNTALTLSSFGLCQTTLLFPYVLSTAPFDTGIAISNTGLDPFTSNSAKGTPGSCTLNFYGAGTPTPSTGVAAPASFYPAGSTLAAGSTGTFLMSTVAGPSFQGYMIAQCNFLYAHGFAYIAAYGLGSPTGAALGYLANVLPNTGRVATGYETLGF